MFKKSSLDDTLYEKHSLQIPPGGAKPFVAHSLNGFGHVIIMAATIIYGKNNSFFEKSSPEPEGR